MPSSGTGLRIRESSVHFASQDPPSHALQGAAVEGVAKAHGGAPALAAQQPQRPAACAQDRRPRPPFPPDPLPPQGRHPQAGPGAAGDSEPGADGRGDRNSDCSFLAIMLESCLIHVYGFCMVLPMWG